MVKNNKALLFFKIMRGVLNDQAIMISNMRKTIKKQKIPYSEIRNINLSDPDFIGSLTPEMVSALLKTAVSLAQNQNDLKDFMQLDEPELRRLQKNIERIVKDLDKALAVK